MILDSLLRVQDAFCVDFCVKNGPKRTQKGIPTTKKSRNKIGREPEMFVKRKSNMFLVFWQFQRLFEVFT